MKEKISMIKAREQKLKERERNIDQLRRSLTMSKTIELNENDLMLHQKKSGKESDKSTERGRTCDKENRNYQNF